MTESYPWFSRLVRHPARKQFGSILTTPDPIRGVSCHLGLVLKAVRSAINCASSPIGRSALSDDARLTSVCRVHCEYSCRRQLLEAKYAVPVQLNRSMHFLSLCGLMRKVFVISQLIPS